MQLMRSSATYIPSTIPGDATNAVIGGREIVGQEYRAANISYQYWLRIHLQITRGQATRWKRYGAAPSTSSPPLRSSWPRYSHIKPAMLITICLLDSTSDKSDTSEEPSKDWRLCERKPREGHAKSTADLIGIRSTAIVQLIDSRYFCCSYKPKRWGYHSAAEAIATSRGPARCAKHLYILSAKGPRAPVP